MLGLNTRENDNFLAFSEIIKNIIFLRKIIILYQKVNINILSTRVSVNWHVLKVSLVVAAYENEIESI